MYQGKLLLSNPRGELESFLDVYRLPHPTVLYPSITKVHGLDGEKIGTAGSILLAMDNPNVVALVVVVAKLHPRERIFHRSLPRDIVVDRMTRVVSSIIGKDLDTRNWWMALRLLSIPRFDCCEEMEGARNILKFKPHHRFLNNTVRSMAMQGAVDILYRKEKALNGFQWNSPIHDKL